MAPKLLSSALDLFITPYFGYLLILCCFEITIICLLNLFLYEWNNFNFKTKFLSNISERCHFYQRFRIIKRGKRKQTKVYKKNALSRVIEMGWSNAKNTHLSYSNTCSWLDSWNMKACCHVCFLWSSYFLNLFSRQGKVSQFLERSRFFWEIFPMIFKCKHCHKHYLEYVESLCIINTDHIMYNDI